MKRIHWRNRLPGFLKRPVRRSCALCESRAAVRGEAFCRRCRRYPAGAAHVEVTP